MKFRHDPRAKLALIALALALLYAPTFTWLITAWLGDPYYSHGPLVLLGAAYLLWARRPDVKLAPELPSNLASALGLALVVAGVGIHVAALFWRGYFVSAMTLPVVAGGIMLALLGSGTTRRFLFPLGFLVLMVPLPLAESIGPSLEALAASASTFAVNLFGVHATNFGSQVFLPDTPSPFSVGIPCGGLHSLISLVTLTAALAYIMEGHWLARLGLLALAAPIALAANIARLVILFGIAHQWGTDAAMNYFHDWASPVLLLIALGLLIFAARALSCDRPAWDRILPGAYAP